ncbi:hypothetical protein FJT64_019193 [Amphibalanus amphitrite]|uniref:Uncharacterized protein n=1 Tax=Amphibalanus amphitrite TaxID=1232801 RepID=A0A6A4X0U2_AMPAM|nr:hypothetical protein FJT64_019193 [Amphibalanus amphitrite]
MGSCSASATLAYPSAGAKHSHATLLQQPPTDVSGEATGLLERFRSLEASQEARTEEGLILQSLNMIRLIGLTLFVQLDLQALQLSLDLLHMVEF